MPVSSSAYVRVENAQSIFENLIAHALEHEAPVDRTNASNASIAIGRNSINLSAAVSELRLTVTAESESLLYFLKESAAKHLAELDELLAARLTWQETTAETAQQDRPVNFHIMRVEARSTPVDSMMRLRLSSNRSVAALGGPGIHVKLMRPANRDRAAAWPRSASNGLTIWPAEEDQLHVRYYTIRSVDPRTNTIDIDIVRHQHGALAAWAEKAEKGEEIGLMGPAGGESPEGAGSVLLAGDQTALPALARFLEELETGVSGDVIGAARSLEELKAYLPTTDLTLHAVAPGEFEQKIVETARHCRAARLPEFAWFAGEHGNAQAMRKVFKSEFKLRKGRQYAISYWRRGRETSAA